MKKEKDILVGGMISWLIGLPVVIYMQINSLIYMYLVVFLMIFSIYWIYKTGPSKFEILNPRVEIERVVDRVSHVSIAKTEKHEVETKAVYIDVKNKNPDVDLMDCKIGMVTKSGGWYTMNLENLLRDVSKTVRLFRIFPNSSVVSPFESKNGVKLDIGKVHELKIRFFGKKFVSKKIWRMELDLISWDSHSLRFKTRREVLKEKMGWRRI